MLSAMQLSFLSCSSHVAWVLDAGCWMLDAWCLMFGAVLNAWYLLLDSEHHICYRLPPANPQTATELATNHLCIQVRQLRSSLPRGYNPHHHALVDLVDLVTAGLNPHPCTGGQQPSISDIALTCTRVRLILHRKTSHLCIIVFSCPQRVLPCCSWLRVIRLWLALPTDVRYS